MKKTLLMMPLLVIALFGCDKNSGGGNEGGGGVTPPVQVNDGLTQATAFTATEAVAKMEEAGDGKIVGTNVQYYVKGVFDAGTTYNTTYSQWYGTCGTFKVSGATNNSGVTPNNADSGLDGATFIVHGFLEKYNGEYKMGFLPKSVSPTGEKFTPELVYLANCPTGGGGTQGGGGGETGDLDGLTSLVKYDFSSTAAKEGSGEHGRLSNAELKALFVANASASKLSDATGSNVYQGYVPSTGDTSAYKDGVSGCIRAGGSSKTGEIALTLTENVKGIKLYAHGWKATDTISVNGASAVTMTLDFAAYTFKFTAGSSVTITTTNRAFIQSIELFK